MKIYFDGYCPESLLKGERVEMRLNEDDFWESEATGLQMTIFAVWRRSALTERNDNRRWNEAMVLQYRLPVSARYYYSVIKSFLPLLAGV